jgi:hypothetical protein
MFTASSFGYYLISFYMATSPGNIFLNFAYVGLGDAFAAVLVMYMQYQIDILRAFRISVYCLFFSSAIYAAMVDKD